MNFHYTSELPQDVILYPLRPTEKRKIADYDLTLVAAFVIVVLVGFVAGAIIF